MYDRYMPPNSSFRPVEHIIPNGTIRLGTTDRSSYKQNQKPPNSDLLGELTGGIRDFLGRVFEGFSFQNLDTSDILLLLIILFLYLEGDNLELVIALGVMLLLNLGTDESSINDQNEEQFHPGE